MLRNAITHGRRARRRSHPGFTLIEVLVVVAIIALLASILLPSLAAARRQAKTVMCKTNLRTIGQALVFYLQANKDSLPYSGEAFERIHRYVQKVGVKNATATTADVDIEWYLCPSDEIPHTTSQVTDPRTGRILQYETGYGINTSLVYSVRPKSNDPGTTRKMSSVKRASDIVSMCDSGDDDFNGAGPWYLSEKNHITNQVGHELHHKTGNNFLYCDGHVGYSKLSMKPPQYGLPTFPTAWIPNYDGEEYKDWVRDPPVP